MLLIARKEKETLSSCPSHGVARSIYLLGFCTHWIDMSAIPQSYLIAKTRKKKSKGKEIPSASSNQYDNFGNSLPDQPLCYSEKMMTSIWGQYNKYSVHNLKAVETDAQAAFNAPGQLMLQQGGGPSTSSLPSTQHAFQKDFSGYASQQPSDCVQDFQDPIAN